MNPNLKIWKGSTPLFEDFCRFLGRFINPNQMSVLSFVLAVPLVPLYYYGNVYWKGASIFLFVLCYYGDRLDGAIARSCNLVSDMGKIIDPLADKLRFYLPMFLFLLCCKLPAFTKINLAPFLVLFGLDVYSTLERGLKPSGAKGANYFGKAKTFFCAWGFFFFLVDDFFNHTARQSIAIPSIIPIGNYCIYFALGCASVSILKRVLRNYASSSSA